MDVVIITDNGIGVTEELEHFVFVRDGVELMGEKSQDLDCQSVNTDRQMNGRLGLRVRLGLASSEHHPDQAINQGKQFTVFTSFGYSSQDLSFLKK